MAKFRVSLTAHMDVDLDVEAKTKEEAEEIACGFLLYNSENGKGVTTNKDAINGIVDYEFDADDATIDILGVYED